MKPINLILALSLIAVLTGCSSNSSPLTGEVVANSSGCSDIYGDASCYAELKITNISDSEWIGNLDSDLASDDGLNFMAYWGTHALDSAPLDLLPGHSETWAVNYHLASGKQFRTLEFRDHAGKFAWQVPVCWSVGVNDSGTCKQ